jgi:hypothetical protein
MKRTMALSVAAVLCYVVSACSSDNEADRTFDCGSICAKYSDCITDIDLTECTDYCEDQADANPNIEAAADACDDCIEDRSCAEATQCASTCKLVPITTD